MFSRKHEPDYAKLSYDQLLVRRSELDAEIRARGTVEIDDLKRRLQMIADAQGVPVQELFSIKKERKERKAKLAKVKFRNPDNPDETWSGLGKPKKWLQQKLDQGRALDEFSI